MMNSMMNHFNWFDYLLLGIFFVSAIFGLIRGFVREVVSLITWGVAFLVGMLFADTLALYFQSAIKSQATAQFLSFILLFIVVLIIGALINFILGKIIGHIGASSLNRFFGFIFGLLRGGLIVLFIVFIISSTRLQEQAWFSNSKLTYWFQDASVWIYQHVINVNDTRIQAIKKKVKKASD